MDSIERLLGRLATLLLIIGGIAIMVMMLHITADVLSKVGLNAPIIGTLEFVAVVYMVVATFMPLAHVQMGRGHIIVELFTQKLPAQVNLALDTFAGLLTSAYLVLLAWMGGVNAIHKTAIGETQDATFFDMPVWPSRWVLVAGCAAAGLIAIFQMFADGRAVLRGEPRRALPGNHQI